MSSKIKLCHGCTSSGRNCRRVVKNGSYCFQHLPWQIGGHDPRQLIRLSGVNDLYFYTNVLGRKILLLGESHDFEGMCSPTEDTYLVEDYLWDLSVNAPECLDIFIERPRYASDIPKHRSRDKPSSPLEKIEKKFESSELPSNLRLHQVDIRHYYDLKKSVYPDRFFLLDEVIDGIRTKTISDDGIRNIKLFVKEHIEDMEMIAKYLIGIDTTPQNKTHYHNFVIDIAKSGHIEHRYYQERDDAFLHAIHKEIHKRLNKLDPRINGKEFVNSIIETFTEEINTINPYETLRDLTDIIMNTYTLLRLFTHFDQSKSHGPIGCQNMDIKNCVIYSGSAHTLFFSQFIRLLGSYDSPDIGEYHDVDDDDKCIIFEEPFDFFRGKPR